MKIIRIGVILIKFNAIMEDIKNDTSTYDNNINLYIFIKKLLNLRKLSVKEVMDLIKHLIFLKK